ncbi:MAG: phosphoheptose isomerase [Candidatus Eremiobacterota bacterium]
MEAFRDAREGDLALACLALARRFARGGQLLALGQGACVTDAAHVAVEFLHPVLPGKRALPALAVTPTSLARLARPEDALLAMACRPPGAAFRRALRRARRHGLLTLALTGPEQVAADYHFPVASHDPWVIQEVAETAYHVLWELVHVFLGQEERG